MDYKDIIDVTDNIAIGPSAMKFPELYEEIRQRNFDHIICVADKNAVDERLRDKTSLFVLDSSKRQNQFADAVREVRQCTARGEKLYIHCWDGRTRCSAVTCLAEFPERFREKLEDLQESSGGQVCNGGGWWEYAETIRVTEFGGKPRPAHAISEYQNIELYSAMPYAGKDGEALDEWFHVGRNEQRPHIEALWDIEKLLSPDLPERVKPMELIGLEGHFANIRLHYALDYTSHRYHENLLLWCIKSLQTGGHLQIITRNPHYIFRYWLVDAVGEPMESGEPDSIAELRQDATAHLDQAEFPITQLQPISRREIAKASPDLVSMDRDPDRWEFDLWLNQMLYSSGAGEPQDTFKSLVSEDYLAVILKRTGFVLKSINTVPNNPLQLEAIAFRHPSKLIGIDFAESGEPQDEGEFLGFLKESQ